MLYFTRDHVWNKNENVLTAQTFYKFYNACNFVEREKFRKNTKILKQSCGKETTYVSRYGRKDSTTSESAHPPFSDSAVCWRASYKTF